MKTQTTPEKARRIANSVLPRWQEANEALLSLADQVEVLKLGIECYQLQLAKDTVETYLQTVIRQGVEISELTAERDQLKETIKSLLTQRETWRGLCANLEIERDTALKLAAERLVDAERYRMIKTKMWMESGLEATIDAARATP